MKLVKSSYRVEFYWLGLIRISLLPKIGLLVDEELELIVFSFYHNFRLVVDVNIIMDIVFVIQILLILKYLDIQISI